MCYFAADSRFVVHFIAKKYEKNGEEYFTIDKLDVGSKFGGGQVSVTSTETRASDTSKQMR